MNNNLISEYKSYLDKTKKEITYEEFLEMLVRKLKNKFYQCNYCGYRITSIQKETIKLDLNSFCPRCKGFFPIFKEVE